MLSCVVRVRVWSVPGIVARHVLAEDFGFKDRMWVYSGRRGIHCWVSDDEARLLSNEGRSAIVEYLTAIKARGAGKPSHHAVVLSDVVSSYCLCVCLNGPLLSACFTCRRVFPVPSCVQGSSEQSLDAQIPLTAPLHPSFKYERRGGDCVLVLGFGLFVHAVTVWSICVCVSRAIRILTPFFLKYIVSEEGQGLLVDRERWERVLNALPASPADLRASVEAEWNKKGMTPLKRWDALQEQIQRAIDTVGRKSYAVREGRVAWVIVCYVCVSRVGWCLAHR